MSDQELAQVVQPDAPAPTEEVEVQQDSSASVSNEADPKVGDEMDETADEQDASDEGDTENSDEDGNPENPKRIKGYKGKYLREKAEREALQTMLQTQIFGSQNQQSQGSGQQVAGDDPRPTRPDKNSFETMDELLEANFKYAEDLSEWTKREAAREYGRRESAREYEKLIAPAKEKHPDFDAKATIVGQLHMRGAVHPELSTVLSYSKNAGEMLYHFGANPGELVSISQRLYSMNPYDARKFVEAIEDRFAKPQAQTKTEQRQPVKPIAPKEEKPVMSKAPAPVTPVQKSGPVKNPTLEEMDFKEYCKAREEQIKKRAK